MHREIIRIICPPKSSLVRKKCLSPVIEDCEPQKLQNRGMIGFTFEAVQVLYENSSGGVLLNSQLGEFIKKTVTVRQGCLLLPVLFYLFLEKTMQDTPRDRHTSISISNRPIYNLLFADHIDLMGSNNGKLQDLTERLADRARGVEVSTEKTNRTEDIREDIRLA